MSVLDTDMWPNDIFEGEMITPLSMMKKQASLIGAKTHNLLEGEVVSRPLSYSEAKRFMNMPEFADGRLILHRFEIVAPVLGDYRYPLFEVVNSVTLYPITTEWGTGGWYKDESEFVQALSEILQSERTKKIIKDLIAQSRA